MMLLEQLELYAMGIRKPNRVVISGDPIHAVCLRQARRHGVKYDTILVRKDGWAIGTTREWRAATYALYQKEWDAIIALRNGSIYRLNESEVDR